MKSLKTCGRLMGFVFCTVVLGACSSAPKVKELPSMAKLMEGASAAASTGQSEQAIKLWKEAAQAYPADKGPWSLIAHTRYEAGLYGEAIVNAQEVLVRDPNDTKANSIIAISGLRLSTRALADLSRQNDLQGPLRAESQNLAKLLRESLGESVLIPAHEAAPVKQPRTKPAARPTTAKSADPFGSLN
jgi:tetratricopeptide (TPR) repeat protein